MQRIYTRAVREGAALVVCGAAIGKGLKHEEDSVSFRRDVKRLRVTMEECGFALCDDRWVWDPDMRGIAYVFGPMQQAARLDAKVRALLEFPLHWRHWKAR